MYSERTLRRRANKIGYTIEKGLFCLTSGAIVYPKQSGYALIDNRYNVYVAGTNNTFCHTWDIEDVEKFLRDEYKSLGLAF